MLCFSLWECKWMVSRHITAFFFRPLKHWPIHYPKEVVLIVVNQVKLFHRRRTRKAPSVALATSRVSATKRTRSLSSNCKAAVKSLVKSVKNFATGPFKAPSAYFTQARPFLHRIASQLLSIYRCLYESNDLLHL